MIDVKLTNSKLIDRGTLIVKGTSQPAYPEFLSFSDFCNCDYDKAREAILKSIHSTDSVTDEVKSKVRHLFLRQSLSL